jgi:YcaO-like protein with predicted kinase domain
VLGMIWVIGGMGEGFGSTVTASIEASGQLPAASAAGDKVYFDGTHRALPPQETWQRIKPHLLSLGITRVAVITGLDVVGIPVVMVTRPNARSLSVSQGKGCDLWCAKVSGVMESIEQHCAEHLDLPLRYASFDELRRKHLALGPSRVPCLQSAALEGRSFLWVEAVREEDGAPCWVPHGLVHLDLRRPLAPGSDLFPLSSNGLASGNTRGEAVVHAVLEIIERDAWARFMDQGMEERERRRLDLSSVSDARAAELIAKLQGAGLNVVVWDLSGALGVACFLCQLVEGQSDWAFQMGRAEGLGCHTHRGIALQRALCEAAQSRLCAIAGSRDDMTRASVARVRAPLAVKRAQLDLAGDRSAGCDFAQLPTREFGSFEAELRWLISSLRRWAGAELFTVDIPSQGVPVHVVRAIVTGLRSPHFLSLRPPRPSFGGEARA